MTGTAKILGSGSPSLSAAEQSRRRQRWVSLQDLLGGALLLAAWIALWTVTWAAVAGPLSPAEAPRAGAEAAAVRT